MEDKLFSWKKKATFYQQTFEWFFFFQVKYLGYTIEGLVLSFISFICSTMALIPVIFPRTLF